MAQQQQEKKETDDDIQKKIKQEQQQHTKINIEQQGKIAMEVLSAMNIKNTAGQRIFELKYLWSTSIMKQLPNYNEKITNKCISFEEAFEKACANGYKNVQEFHLDLKIMYENSAKYNGTNSNYTRHLQQILQNLKFN